jgi:hypothetical protein
MPPSQAEGSAPPSQAEGSAPPSQGKRMAKVRRGLAAALLLGWLVTLFVSTLNPSGLHVCDDEIARVGSTALVKTCRPLAITDAPMLAVLVIVGILLFPDLSALEIPGVLRVERKLEQQARRQDEIVATVHRLEASQQQQQQQQVYNYNVVGAAAAKLGELAALQGEKREHFDSDAS